jgi:alpha-beta hydrolase superfamily lysophospholipase
MERSAPGRPVRTARERGLAYALWLPNDPPPWPAIVIVHGASSRKENHADFARLATAGGWAALAFDLPGHGDSEPDMSDAAVGDVIAMAAVLGSVEGVDPRRVGVRGSSLGGFLAITAAAASAEIAGVIAICPPSEEHLARGLRRGNLEMRVGDSLAMEAWLMAQDIGGAVERIAPRPLILMHAEGDTQVPSDHSEELYERAGEPRKLVIVPGGAHQTVQHDAELQGMALRWLERELAGREPTR